MEENIANPFDSFSSNTSKKIKLSYWKFWMDYPISTCLSRWMDSASKHGM